MVAYVLESASTVDRRVHSGQDLFAHLPPIQPREQESSNTIKMSFKSFGPKKFQTEGHYRVMPVTASKEAVPSYRFHHIGISKNINSPNTMLTYVPHVRDLQEWEEPKYDLWLSELEECEGGDGLQLFDRDEKLLRVLQSERARDMAPYIDTWLERLNITGCDRASLFRHLTDSELKAGMTPQEKERLLAMVKPSVYPSWSLTEAAAKFVDGFKLAFESQVAPKRQIKLRHAMLVDETLDLLMGRLSMLPNESAPNGAAAGETAPEPLEQDLTTYAVLGCLICFSHSCEHGEFDQNNVKHPFALSSEQFPLRDALRRRQRRYAGATQEVANKEVKPTPPCNRSCHRSKLVQDSPRGKAAAFSRDEIGVLRGIVETTRGSSFKGDPVCLAALILNRPCRDVGAEWATMETEQPAVEVEEPEARRPRTLPWYDRFRKVLIGDWQDQTLSHQHGWKDIVGPCRHDGPCTIETCDCAASKVLCDRFCGCTARSCPIRFTGCSCHARGKLCTAEPSDWQAACPCVQLNRECDPDLCQSCGVIERADPINAFDDHLHATGCQNCKIQRGREKVTLLGRSRLPGAGYGLYSAEPIRRGEFVSEYVGETIDHDEGVRREARRGNVFAEGHPVSYLFTLLETEGIWVDAAIYGNLSRYINHAPERSQGDSGVSNVTPQIMYVNGDYRIQFTAARDIRVGEELFFDYGDEFPNLTQKLLDAKSSEAKPQKKKEKEKQKPKLKGKEKEKGKQKQKQKQTPAIATADSSSESGSTVLSKGKRAFHKAKQSEAINLRQETAKRLLTAREKRREARDQGWDARRTKSIYLRLSEADQAAQRSLRKRKRDLVEDTDDDDYFTTMVPRVPRAPSPSPPPEEKGEEKRGHEDEANGEGEENEDPDSDSNPGQDAEGETRDEDNDGGDDDDESEVAVGRRPQPQGRKRKRAARESADSSRPVTTALRGTSAGAATGSELSEGELMRRRRGRPKLVKPAPAPQPAVVKRPRGRPRKYPRLEDTSTRPTPSSQLMDESDVATSNEVLSEASLPKERRGRKGKDTNTESTAVVENGIQHRKQTHVPLPTQPQTRRPPPVSSRPSSAISLRSRDVSTISEQATKTPTSKLDRSGERGEAQVARDENASSATATAAANADTHAEAVTTATDPSAAEDSSSTPTRSARRRRRPAKYRLDDD